TQAGSNRQPVRNKFFSGLRNENLATVRHRHQARAAVKGSTHVVTRPQLSLARVHCDAHADFYTRRPALTLQRTLRGKRTCDRITSLGEYGEHTVSLASRLDDLPPILINVLNH